MTWFVTVHNAKTCSWSSSPKIAGFDGTVKCSHGRILRQFTIRANPAAHVRWYALSLTAHGAHIRVSHLRIVEAAAFITRTTLALGYYLTQQGLPLVAQVKTLGGTVVTAGTMRFQFVVNGSKRVDLLATLSAGCIASLEDSVLALHITSSNNASADCTGGGTVPLVRGRGLTVRLSAIYSGTPGYLPSVSPTLAIPATAIVGLGRTTP